MDIIPIIVTIVIIGVILWAVNTYVPMAAPIKTILNIVVIVLVGLWLLNVLGFSHLYVGNPHSRP